MKIDQSHNSLDPDTISAVALCSYCSTSQLLDVRRLIETQQWECRHCKHWFSAKPADAKIDAWEDEENDHEMAEAEKLRAHAKIYTWEAVENDRARAEAEKFRAEAEKFRAEAELAQALAEKARAFSASLNKTGGKSKQETSPASTPPAPAESADQS